MTAKTNRSKSDKDPAQWLPPAASAQCTYASDWVATKLRWKLTIDTKEQAALEKLAGGCPERRGVRSRPVARRRRAERQEVTRPSMTPAAGTERDALTEKVTGFCSVFTTAVYSRAPRRQWLRTEVALSRCSCSAAIDETGHRSGPTVRTRQARLAVEHRTAPPRNATPPLPDRPGPGPPPR